MLSEKLSMVPPPPGSLEKLCWGVVLVSGSIIAFSVFVVLAGTTPWTAGTWLAPLVADQWALFWITLGSMMHLAFVPVLCVAIAKRDARRGIVGIAVPEPRSKWRGYESVFLDAETSS